MDLILRGKRWGFSLEEIRQWLEMYDKEDNTPQLTTLLEMAERQLVALESQHKELSKTLVDLREMRDRTRTRLINAKI
jgi:DNA-binding transcriptional MerR regulator